MRTFILLTWLLLSICSYAKTHCESMIDFADEITVSDTVAAVLPGIFNVSSSGGATFTVPIDLPPGRAGMKPELSFYYNSQQKVGNILGQGWSITGFSSITRTNPTIYHNKVNGYVDFENDELLLDGQHLILVGEGEYKTELDNISKITELTNVDGAKYFVVYTKDGFILEYGNSSNSRQVYTEIGGNPDTDTPLAWHINKMQDRNGNTVIYNYQRSPTMGELHPESIYYTSHEINGNPDLPANTKISFIYGTTSINEKIQHTFYLEKSGQPYLNKNSWLLEKIRISDYSGSEPIKDYIVNYYQQKGVCKEFFIKDITAVNYTGAIASAAKPTRFYWDFYNPLYQENLLDFVMTQSNKPFQSLGIDFNGDNSDEIVASFTKRDEFTLENQDMIVVYGIGPQGFIELEISSPLVKLYSIDWDNNGDYELLIEDNDVIKIFDYNVNTELLDQVYYNSNLGPIGSIYIGDVTGDAINDIIINNSATVTVLVGEKIANGSFSFVLNQNSLIISDYNSLRTVGDFNGDGTCEVLCKNNSGSDLSFNLYSFNELSGFVLLNFFSIPIANPPDPNPVFYYKDFNGDGKIDICYFKNDSGLYTPKIYFSFGNGFTTEKGFTNTFDTPPTFVEDINNDGRADFVKLSFFLDKLKLRCYMTNPHGTSAESLDIYTFPGSYSGNKCNINLANINSNCIKDFILFNSMPECEPEPPNHCWDNISIYTFSDVGIGNNVITTIRNGFNVVTKLKYSDFGTEGSVTASFPLAKPTLKDNVVSESYTEGENNTKLNWKQYSFYSPTTHLKGKGFLGFKETRVLLPQENLLNISVFDIIKSDDNRYFFHYCSQSSVWSMNGGIQDKLLSESSTTIKLKPRYTGSLVFFPIVSKSVAKTWDNDENHTYKGIVIHNCKETDVDSYGNVLKQENFMDESEVNPEPANRCSWEQIVTNSYLPPDPERWLVGRPSMSVVTTYHKPEDPSINPDYSVSMEFSYYENTNLIQKRTVIPNNNNDLKTEHSYLYDSFGNTVTVTTTAKVNENNDNRTVEYYYKTVDGFNGRFLTSKSLKANNNAATRDQQFTYEYDLKTGNLSKSIDLNVNTTEYDYDNFGRLKKSKLPDNTSIEIVIDWSANFTEFSAPVNAVYYSTSFKKLETVQEKWGRTISFYDKFHKLIRTVSQGLTGDFIYIDYQYDNLGRVSQVSEPYFIYNTPSLWTTFSYDNLGRLVSKTLPTGVIITTEYYGRTTKTKNTSTEIWKETTVNILGAIEMVNDPSEGAINYDYDAAKRVRSIISHGTPTLFEYDDAGNCTKTIDPDAGETTRTFNGFGDLVTETDNRGSSFLYTYDEFGRMLTSYLTPDNAQTTFIYCERPESGFGQLKSVSQTINDDDETKIEYIYDELGRVTSKKKKVDNINYEFLYTYNSNSGMLEYYTYPSNYQIKYTYNNLGYMNGIIETGTDCILWAPVTANQRGQITKFDLGNGLTSQRAYDAYGFPWGIMTKNNSTNAIVQNIYYDFDQVTGNLLHKAEDIPTKTFLNEYYQYDPVLKSRLISWRVNESAGFSVNYLRNGNISFKSDVTSAGSDLLDNIPPDPPVPATGSYNYGANAGPHAVTGITKPTDDYATSALYKEITYTGFNKVQTIVNYKLEGLTVKYGPDHQRIKSILAKKDNPESMSILKIKYFLDDYEKETDYTTLQSRQLHYISAPTGLVAIVEIKNNVTSPFYIHSDYQGNYNMITNSLGNVVERLSFDPWGRRRNPNDWSYDNVPTTFLFDRGYTGHEHLDKFGLINMNGRVYDPRLARFLSPDPFIQDPTNSQSHNRYSYCLNNPLKYVDPSGYFLVNGSRKPLGDQQAISPVINIESLFNGGMGLIGPGSMSHWSDNSDIRTSFGTFMLGSPFVNSCINERYTQLYGYFVTTKNAINNAINNKNPETETETEMVFGYIDAGFTITSIDAFGQNIHIATLGPPGEINTRPNGGIIFENHPAFQVWGSTEIIDSPSGQTFWDTNGDGKLQKDEADNWWLIGGGSISVDNSKINWTGLKIPASAKVGKIFSIKTTQAFFKLPYETAATYGGTSFILRGAHTVEVVDQLYHYQYRPNNSAENVIRNLMNWYGKPNGQGTDFMIHYYNPLIIIK